VRPGECLGGARGGGGGPALGHGLGPSERREAVLEREVLIFGIHLGGIGRKRVASLGCGPVRESGCEGAQTRGVRVGAGRTGWIWRGWPGCCRRNGPCRGVARTRSARCCACAGGVALVGPAPTAGSEGLGRCNRQNTVAPCDWTAAPRLFTCPECLAGGEKPSLEQARGRATLTLSLLFQLSEPHPKVWSSSGETIEFSASINQQQPTTRNATVPFRATYNVHAGPLPGLLVAQSVMPRAMRLSLALARLLDIFGPVLSLIASVAQPACS